MFQKRYFKFNETGTEVLTKNVGYACVLELPSIHMLEVPQTEGPSKLVIVKDEIKSVPRNYQPKGDNIFEISKEEYDALDVSAESAEATARREKFEKALIVEEKNYFIIKNTPIKRAKDYVASFIKATKGVVAEGEEHDALLAKIKSEQVKEQIKRSA